MPNISSITGNAILLSEVILLGPLVVVSQFFYGGVADPPYSFSRKMRERGYNRKLPLAVLKGFETLGLPLYGAGRAFDYLSRRMSSKKPI